MQQIKFGNTVKALLRGNFIVLGKFIRKERSEINNLSFQFKKLKERKKSNINIKQKDTKNFGASVN